jgi:hypothetical protein
MDIKKLFESVLNGNIDLPDVENWVKSEEVNFQRPDIKTGLDQFSENDLDHLIDKYSDWEIRVNECDRRSRSGLFQLIWCIRKMLGIL